MLKGRGALILAALLWSLAGVFTKGLQGLDAGSIAFYRGIFAGLALLPFVRPSRWTFRPPMIPLMIVFGAMTGLYIGAIKQSTAANAIFLQYSAAIWAVPISFIFLKERPDQRVIRGLIAVALGVLTIVIFGPGEGSGTSEALGIALGIGSGVTYAIVAVGLRALRGHDPFWLSAINNLGGSIVLGTWLIMTTGGIPIPTLPQTLALMAFGMIQMAIPYALFARGLRTIPAPEAGLISLLEPILQPVWVILAIGEYPSWPTLVGGFFLLFGVILRYLPKGIHSTKVRGSQNNESS